MAKISNLSKNSYHVKSDPSRFQLRRLSITTPIDEHIDSTKETLPRKDIPLKRDCVIEKGDAIEREDAINQCPYMQTTTLNVAAKELVMKQRQSGKCIDLTRKQLAACIRLLVHTPRSAKIDLKIMDVQMQAGGRDCGVFAIAYATSIVNGLPLFDQPKMRRRLYKCLLFIP